MTAAEILRDALTQYAQQTLGRDRALAERMSMEADEIAESMGYGWAPAAKLSDDANHAAAAQPVWTPIRNNDWGYAW